MKRARALAPAVGGGLAFLAAALRVDADGAELARLVILGAALGGLAIVAAILALSLVSPASFGMGDVKLALLLVLGLGGLATEALVLGLVLAAAFGSVLMLRHGRNAARWSLPLAPFLSGGAAMAVLL